MSRDGEEAAEVESATAAAELPYRREFFEALPTEPGAQWVYLQQLHDNYIAWKRTSAARRSCRRQVLVAFEKLLQHTTELTHVLTVDGEENDAANASFLQKSFVMLRERWNDFMDRSDRFSHVVMRRNGQNHRGFPKSVDRVEEGSFMDVTIDSFAAVASNGLEEDMLRSTGVPWVPVCELEFESNHDSESDADDDDDCSEVSVAPTTENDMYGTPHEAQVAIATKGLFRAVEQDDRIQVERFVAYHANVNGRCDVFGERPLHKAAALGNLDIVKCLRLWGANPWCRNTAGELPLHVTCFHGHVESAKCLLEQLFVGHHRVSLSDLLDARGRTPFHLACQGGHFSLMYLLYEKFGDRVVDLRDRDNLSPRHYALLGRHYTLVHLLDRYGADRSDDSSFDPTDFHHACLTGRVGLAKWIFEETRDGDLLHAKDSHGRTPLECAKASDNPQMIEWMNDCILAHQRAFFVRVKVLAESGGFNRD